MKKSYIWLIASIAIAFGGWAVNAASWAELLAVGMLPTFIAQIGSVLVAWLGESPLKPKP